MPQTNILRRYLDAGMAFTQLTQSRAEAIVRDLVQAGEVQTGQAQATVAELVERSRKNTERLFEQVRRDVRDQVSNLGLATKSDISRLERQISTLSTRSGGAATSASKTSASKTSARKTSARKTSATKSPAKKSSTKTSAKKSPTKKRAAAKTASKARR